VLLGLENGKQRSRNLWKLVALALDKQELSPGEFAESLRLMRDYNVQQTDASLDTSDSVKLMTIHSSKGLEFPAVILPVLDAVQAPRSERIIYHREFGIAFNTARSDSEPKPAYYQVATAISEEMELAEKKRLFYVATTRARDYLGLFFNADSRNMPSFRTWLRDWLGVDEAEEGNLVSEREKLCSVSYVEVLENSLASNEEQPVEHVEPASFKWDLIWPSMDGELQAPPVSAGVRVTPGQSRQRLDPAVIGTMFHALMENLSHDLAPLSDEILQCVALAQGDSVADLKFRQCLITEARALMSQFYESDLYLSLKSARRRFHEMPYYVAREHPMSKRPDLLFEDHHGRWHLVDYKTDRIDVAEMEMQGARHAKQLSGYVTELRALTGIEFSASLYFAQFGKLVPIKQDQSLALV
jgi:ATP-dependent helicase/nuclease subunit A